MDIVIVVLAIAMLLALNVAAPVLGRRRYRRLVRREEARLQRDLAEADAFHERFFSDPEFALAYVRQRSPEEHELIVQLERHAAQLERYAVIEGHPWLPGEWRGDWRTEREYLTTGDAMRWTPPEASK